MKLHADSAEGVNLIQAYTRTSVSVNGQTYTRSILVPATGPMIEWAATSLADLQESHFDAVVQAAPEVLILGTGASLRFPKPAVLRALMAARIGVETMDTAAACRTYNILVAEGRRVMAALLIAD
ncbi:MAG: Mth938-like domain-containing protein [Proteobacteria bacterium]|uniref:Mth938-like domain-containing protein n=1 Tax=Aquabacterium sp. TaxID=1872578 RepID=UPI0035C67206|nr:Mth938-like domain-containing protein [Pseudomonadota bacterium]